MNRDERAMILGRALWSGVSDRTTVIDLSGTKCNTVQVPTAQNGSLEWINLVMLPMRLPRNDFVSSVTYSEEFDVLGIRFIE